MACKKFEETKAEKRERERTNKRMGKKNKNQDRDDSITQFGYRKDTEKLKALTENQARYMMEIESSNLVFGIGPAGTGKSYIPLVMAADQLDAKQIDRLVLTRPLVETGTKVGALPGELDEKLDPFFLPALEILYRRLGKSHVEDLMHNERIVLQPLEYMRGMTFKHSWVILDEAENATETQMKMFLTRVGGDCKVIVNGDPRQSDLKGNSNGLIDAVDRLKDIDEVGITEFEKDEVVRSNLTRKILDAYEKDTRQLI